MPIYEYPGVYTREIDLSYMTSLLSDTTAAAVGELPKGPLGPQYYSDDQTFINACGPSNPRQSLFFNCVLEHLKGGAPVWVNRVVNGAKYPIIKVTATGTLAASDDLADPTAYEFDDELFIIYPVGPGTGYNDLVVQIDTTDLTDGLFYLNVFNSGNMNVPLSSNLCSLKYKKSAGGVQLQLEEVINEGKNRYIKVIKNPALDDDETYPATSKVQLQFTGGDDGAAVGDSQLVNGWDVFRDTRKYEFIRTINAGYTSQAVQQKMANLALERGDHLAILDVPQDKCAPTDAVGFRGTTNIYNSFCAMYAPWIQVFDPDNNMSIKIPPSGNQSAVFTFNDATAEPWYAAAGVTRGKMTTAEDLSYQYQNNEIAMCYKKGINCIVNLPNHGIVTWGQRTMLGDDSLLRDINVRMLLIVLRKSMTPSMYRYVFEFNDATTRRRIKTQLEQLLETVKTRRGVYDYKVQCDEQNNTPAVIRDHILKVDVFIQPTIAAEFVELNCIITNVGASFEEAVV